MSYLLFDSVIQLTLIVFIPFPTPPRPTHPYSHFPSLEPIRSCCAGTLLWGIVLLLSVVVIQGGTCLKKTEFPLSNSNQVAITL